MTFFLSVIAAYFPVDKFGENVYLYVDKFAGPFFPSGFIHVIHRLLGLSLQ